MKKIIFLLTILNFSFTFSQTQIGTDINGEVANDNSGFSVSISANGSVMAIGAHRNDGNGIDSGHVRVYQNISGTWTQIGADINGETLDDASGFSVSLSSDGSVVAIGAQRNDGNGTNSGHVRIYQNIASTWTQVGADINGEGIGDAFGSSVSLSSDGSIVAIGSYLNSQNGSASGHVRVYKNISGTWVQIGSDIDGEALGDNSGKVISLSSNGNSIAIGAPFNDGNGSNSGHVRIYENIAGTWTQVGADINGDTTGDSFGSSVSLSSDGSIVAIGAPFNDSLGSNSGFVRTYKNISGTWTQSGLDIYGEMAGDNCGSSISLSSDGNVLAVASPFSDSNGVDSGKVRVFENIAGLWTQAGVAIIGEAANDYSGWSVSLSSDKNTVAIGAYANDGIGSNAGHVRVFNLAPVLGKSKFNLSGNTAIYPNPTTNEVNINFNEFIAVSTLEIYDINGRLLKTETLKNNTNTINIENLQTGLYLFKIISVNETKTIKIQKN